MEWCVFELGTLCSALKRCGPKVNRQKPAWGKAATVLAERVLGVLDKAREHCRILRVEIRRLEIARGKPNE